MDFDKLARSVAHAAIDNTMDGKNIGEIAESVAETAVEELSKDNFPSTDTQEIPHPSDTKGSDGLITSVVTLVVRFLLKLFK